MTKNDLDQFATGLLALANAPFIVGVAIGFATLIWYMILKNL